MVWRKSQHICRCVWHRSWILTTFRMYKIALPLNFFIFCFFSLFYFLSSVFLPSFFTSYFHSFFFMEVSLLPRYFSRRVSLPDAFRPNKWNNNNNILIERTYFCVSPSSDSWFVITDYAISKLHYAVRRTLLTQYRSYSQELLFFTSDMESTLTVADVNYC